MNCLICLDNCENNFLQFPNNLTKCTCRYCVHDECIDYYKDAMKSNLNRVNKKWNRLNNS